MNSYEELFSKALEAQKNSYSPYSHCKVGAAIATDKGVFSGCNVENASFGGTVCAEQVAILKAISEGATSIQEVLIISPKTEAWPPCGLCRQMLSEFCYDDAPIHMVSQGAEVKKTMTFKELMPETFKLK